MDVMKCDSLMLEYLFDAHCKFDKVHPEVKCKQWFIKLLLEVSPTVKSGKFGEPTSIENSKNADSKKKNSPQKKVFNPLGAELAVSNLLVTPVTSPNVHSPVKPSPDCCLNVEDDDQSVMFAILNSTFYSIQNFQNFCNKRHLDLLYTPNFIEMDST